MRNSIDVHNHLQNKEIQHEIFLVEDPIKTAERAAALLRLEPCKVIKSLIFLIDEEPVLVIVPGNRRACYKKLKNSLGASKVIFANVQNVVDITGYMIGTTPPVAHQTVLRTLIDRRVLIEDVIYTGGGELNAILKIRSQDLEKVTNAQIADVSI